MKKIQVMGLLFFLLIPFSITKAVNQPVGNLEPVDTAGNISGWSFDPSAPSSSVNVQFYVDGTAQANYVAQITTNISRPDVNAGNNISGNHGFFWTIPTKYWDGKAHTLYAVGVSVNNQSVTTQLAGAPMSFSLSLRPVGNLEGIDSAGNISGWSFDPGASSSSINIQFFIDGTAQSNYVNQTSANILRSDVNVVNNITGNHGFFWTVPIKYWDGKQHTLYAMGTNGQNITGQLTGAPLNFTLVIRPAGYIEGVDSAGNVSGWSFDPGSPTASINVQFYIDSTAQANYIAQTVATTLRTDVNSVNNITGNHGFFWTIPIKYWDGKPHTLYALGVGANNQGATTQLTGSPMSFTLSIRPVGNFEGIDATTGNAGGWSFDPGASSSSINIQFFIDGAAQANYTGQTSANLSRPDVNSANSITGNHGFSWVIPTKYWDGKPHTLSAMGVSASNVNATMQLRGSSLNFKLGEIIPPPVPGHIKFFGYDANAGYGGSDGSYLNEVHSYNNFAWIQGSQLTKIQEAIDYNMKSVLDVSTIFFDTSTWRLKTTYKQDWADYASKVQPYIQNIAAFYPLDEPYMIGQTKGVSVKEMQGYLTTAIATIKETFPSSSVGVIFSAPEVIDANPIPQGFDWIGMDCYDNFWNCSGHSIPWYYTQLKSRMNSNQKLIIVPQAISYNSNPATDEQTQLSERADQYIAYAESEPSVIMIMPFEYQNAPDHLFVGAREMSILKTKFQNIGNRMLSSVIQQSSTASSNQNQTISSVEPTPKNPNSQTSSSPATIVQPTSPIFTRNLQINDVSPDVLRLQQYLNMHGFPVSAKGPGSIDNETKIFGKATLTALVKFQKAHNISATGYFGPMTRGVINKLEI